MCSSWDAGAVKCKLGSARSPGPCARSNDKPTGLTRRRPSLNHIPLYVCMYMVYVLSTGTAYARARRMRDAGCGGSWSRAAKYINMEWNQVHLFNEGRKEFARQPQVCVCVCVGACKMNDACGSSVCCTNTHRNTHNLPPFSCRFKYATSKKSKCLRFCTRHANWTCVVCGVCGLSLCVCVCVRWARVQCATFQLMNGQLEKKPPPATSAAA